MVSILRNGSNECQLQNKTAVRHLRISAGQRSSFNRTFNRQPQAKIGSWSFSPAAVGCMRLLRVIKSGAVHLGCSVFSFSDIFSIRYDTPVTDCRFVHEECWFLV